VFERCGACQAAARQHRGWAKRRDGARRTGSPGMCARPWGPGHRPRTE